jgi:hypothetical protein
LVDLYWKEEENVLVAVQVTRSTVHANSPAVYAKFFEKLHIQVANASAQNNQTTLGAITVNLYYLIMPCCADYFSEEDYPASQFFNGVSSSKSYQKWAKKINFRALLPPESFAAMYKETTIPAGSGEVVS